MRTFFIFLLSLIISSCKKETPDKQANLQASIDGNIWNAVSVNAVLVPNNSSGSFRITATGSNGTAIYLRSNDAEATSVSFKTNPATLMTFTGNFDRHISNVATLNWSTATESNLARFDVQRSADAVNFITIGSVTAFGNSTTVKNYSFQEKPPVEYAFSGRAYYRLGAVDVNNQNAYSNIVVLSFGSYTAYKYSTGSTDHGFGKSGTVEITSVDKTNRLISGKFNFIYRDDISGMDHAITNGIFTNVPYQ